LFVVIVAEIVGVAGAAESWGCDGAKDDWEPGSGMTAISDELVCGAGVEAWPAALAIVLGAGTAAGLTTFAYRFGAGTTTLAGLNADGFAGVTTGLDALRAGMGDGLAMV
jgi:hypothetical protein